MRKYGFIGLGDQGAPMARRMIDAGLPTILWARRPETLAPFVDTPAETAATIRELAERVDYVGVCVVANSDVQEVCDQLIPAMRPGGRIVIHSTVHPDLCKTLAAQAAEHGLGLIDAPVSGGGRSAAAGTLTVMVGGDASVVEAARPVLETFGSLVVHLGDVGAGQNAKLINNSMLAANIAIGHYGLEAGARLGVDRDELVRIIKASSGRSFGFDVSAGMSAPANFRHGANLLHKDVGLLGETLGDVPAFTVIRDAAEAFLKLAVTDS